jgi:hypothetical protein
MRRSGATINTYFPLFTPRTVALDFHEALKIDIVAEKKIDIVADKSPAHAAGVEMGWLERTTM